MVRDRGSIKWASIMLPEHLNALRELWDSGRRHYKPIIDGQKKEEMHNLLYEAFEKWLKIEVKYYQDHEHKKVVGYIEKINIFNQLITINDVQINIDDLLDVELK